MSDRNVLLAQIQNYEGKLAGMKEELRRESTFTTPRDSRDFARERLKAWFGVDRIPAKRIDAHWSDEEPPEPLNFPD